MSRSRTAAPPPRGELLRQRPDTALRYVRAYCRGVYRFRTDSAFGIAVLRKYTGESDATVLEGSWMLFARLMGGMMYPSVEGMRTASHVLAELGAIAHPLPPEDSIDLGLVAAVEREGYFAMVLGLGTGAQP
jgi:NitT/TauT family transport system substrate-binding protein